MIAVAHPGKIGDMFYVMPTVAALAKKHGCQVDFYTSKYCGPAVSLLEYQPQVARVIIPDNYVINNFGQGVQPWEIPINPNGYEAVYQLGMRKWPEKGLIEFYAEIAGVTPEPFHFDAPPLALPCSVDRPIVISVCQRTNKDYATAVIRAFGDQYPIYQVGWVGQTPLPGVINGAMPDFLETASIFRNARLYAGGTGANSVLAIAFYPLPCIIAHPGHAFDARHLVPADWVSYMKDPTVDDFIRQVRSRL